MDYYWASKGIIVCNTSSQYAHHKGLLGFFKVDVYTDRPSWCIKGLQLLYSELPPFVITEDVGRR